MIELGPSNISGTIPIAFKLYPASPTNPFTRVDLSNESSVSVLVQVGASVYSMPPQSTIELPLTGTETQITLTPTAAPTVTGSISGIAYNQSDPTPIGLQRGSNFLGGTVGLPADRIPVATLTTVLLGVIVGANPNDSFQILGSGELNWFDGAAASPDLGLFRSGTKTLTLDDGSGGAATLNVVGRILAGTTLGVTGASTFGGLITANLGLTVAGAKIAFANIGAAAGPGLVPGAVGLADNDSHTWESDGLGGLIIRNIWNTVGARIRLFGGIGGVELGRFSSDQINLYHNGSEIFQLGTDSIMRAGGTANEARFGTGAFGAAGAYVRLGDFGDTTNTYWLAAGTGANIGVVMRGKGTSSVQLQEGGGNPILTVENTGHIRAANGAAGAPTVAAGLAGTTATITGNDTDGIVTVTNTSGGNLVPSAFQLWFTITFASAFSGNFPRIVFWPANRTAAQFGGYTDDSTGAVGSAKLFIVNSLNIANGVASSWYYHVLN